MLINSYSHRSALEEMKSKLKLNSQVILPSISNLPFPNLGQITLPPIRAIPRGHELRHKCRNCTKSFKRKNSLIRHERVHTGHKPFLCKVCNKNFTRKDILESHKLSIKCRRRTQNLLKSTTPELNIEPIKEKLTPLALKKPRRTSISSLLWSDGSTYNEPSIESWLPLWLPSPIETYSTQ